MQDYGSLSLYLSLFLSKYLASALFSLYASRIRSISCWGLEEKHPLSVISRRNQPAKTMASAAKRLVPPRAQQATPMTSANKKFIINLPLEVSHQNSTSAPAFQRGGPKTATGRAHKSSGVNPVRLAMRDSNLGPISSPSWWAKTWLGQPGRAKTRCEPPRLRMTVHPIRSSAAKRSRALTAGHRLIENRLPVFQAVGDDPQGQGLHPAGGIVSGGAVNHTSGQGGNLGYMAAVVLNIKFNSQGRDLIEQTQIGGGFSTEIVTHKAPFRKIIPKPADFGKRARIQAEGERK